MGKVPTDKSSPLFVLVSIDLAPSSEDKELPPRMINYRSNVERHWLKRTMWWAIYHGHKVVVQRVKKEA